MIKFKKEHNLKIISLLAVVTFLLNSTVYGISLNSASLRNHLLSNSPEDQQRLKSGLDVMSKSKDITALTQVQLKDYKDEKSYFMKVIAKIQAKNRFEPLLKEFTEYCNSEMRTSQKLETEICDKLETAGLCVIIDYPGRQLFIFDLEEVYQRFSRLLIKKYVKDKPDLEYKEFEKPIDNFLGNAKSIKFVECDNCGSTDMKFVLNYPLAHIISFAQCQKCKVNFMNPQPLVSFWRKVYSDWYFKQNEKHVEVGYFDYEMEKDERIRKAEDQAILIDELIKRVSPAAHNKTILEIGFGYGYFLNSIQRRGWKTAGIEISAHAASKAKQLFPNLADLHEGVVEEASFDGRKFQAVAMFDVLEHVASPTNTIKRIYDLLNDDGIFIFRSPTLKIGDIPQTHLGEHIWHFSIEQVRNFLDKSGFELVGMTSGSFFSARGGINSKVRVVRNIHFFAVKKGYFEKYKSEKKASFQVLLDDIYKENHLSLFKSTRSATAVDEVEIIKEFERVFDEELDMLREGSADKKSISSPGFDLIAVTELKTAL